MNQCDVAFDHEECFELLPRRQAQELLRRWRHRWHIEKWGRREGLGSEVTSIFSELLVPGQKN